LIVFDRLFGTFAATQTDEPIRYGLAHSLPSKNPFVIAMHEWRRMLAEVRDARSLGGVITATLGRPR
jgi:hypothetical protein